MLAIYVFYKYCYNTHTLQHQVLGNLKNFFSYHILCIFYGYTEVNLCGPEVYHILLSYLGFYSEVESITVEAQVQRIKINSKSLLYGKQEEETATTW